MKAYAQSNGTIFLNNLTTPELLDFRSTWENANLSTKKKLELMKAFFKFCTTAKLIPVNPAEGISRRKFKMSRSCHSPTRK